MILRHEDEDPQPQRSNVQVSACVMSGMWTLGEATTAVVSTGVSYSQQ